MPVRLLMRMTAPTIGVSAMLLAMGIGAAGYVYRQQSQTSQLLEHHIETLTSARQLVTSIRTLRGLLNRYLISGDSAFLANVPDQMDEVDRWLDQTGDLALTATGRDKLDAVRQAHDEFRRDFQGVLNSPTTISTRAAVRRLSDERLTADVLALSQLYLNQKLEDVARFSEYNTNLTRWMVAGLLLLGTSGAAAGLMSGFSIARGVSRSMVQLTVPIRDAAGMLDDVVGPITVLAGSSFEEMQGVLEDVANSVARMVEKLRESQQQALRNEQLAAVGQLAAGMAHELRNPLMSMKILVQSAMERNAAHDMPSRDLQILEEEIARLERLISSFLEFARPSKMDRELFDVCEAVRATIDLAAGRAAQQSVTLVCESLPPEALILGDAHHLRQVLLNLLLNALDASPANSRVRIRVTLAGDYWKPDELDETLADIDVGDELDMSSGWVVIEVIDQGCGLPEELGERIFEPFVSTKETGVGLGLSISRRIIEAHHGRIQAAPGVSGGTVITMFLPLANESTAACVEPDVASRT